MTKKGEFYHSLTINTERCLGCTHCVSKCPSGALRIVGGKATLRPNWCLDCAECMKACPVDAIYIEQDDLDKIFDYQNRVVLVPAIFMGQFPEKYTRRQIFGALHRLGFTHLFQVEMSVGLVREAMRRKMAEAVEKPSISPFCPAIVRLIQIRFPNLVGNILPVKTPIELSAQLCRTILHDRGVDAARTGVFYITPCAAKIAIVKGGEVAGAINGVLNMDSIYNRVFHILRSDSTVEADADESFELSAEDVGWSSTAGEAASFEGRCLAVDEVHNVIDFLERMEITGELSNIDFLEMRACDRSCVGGVLTPANRFIAAERMSQITAAQRTSTVGGTPDTLHRSYLKSIAPEVERAPVQPMTKLVYEGEDIGEVLHKMDSAKKIRKLLPGIDCGACGSPGCESLAEDIVRGEATLSYCVFVQRELEINGTLSSERACEIVEQVWGKERLSRTTKKILTNNESK